MLRSNFWRQLRVALMTGLLAGGVGAAVAYFRPQFAAGAEFFCYDEMARLARRYLSAPGREPVVMVGIDESAIEDVRRSLDLGWPWPRSLIGHGVEELKALGAKVVVLDSLYYDYSVYGVDDELEFAQSLRRAGNVVVAGERVDAAPGDAPPRGRWAAHLADFDERPQALDFAATLLARKLHAYVLPEGKKVAVWFGGFSSRRSLEDQLSGLAELGDIHLAHEPAIRELAVDEMREDHGVVDARSWVAARDALKVAGAGALHQSNELELLLPRPEVAAAARVGFADTARAAREANDDSMDNDDQDRPRFDLERAAWLFIHRGDALYPTLPLAALLAAEPEKLSVANGRFHYGERSVPIDRRGFLYITYPQADAFGAGVSNGARDHIGFSAILRSADSRSRHLPTDPKLQAAIKDRYVVVSNLAAGLHDLKPTPIPGLDSGSAVVAATLRTLVLGDAVSRAPHEKDARWAFVLAMLGALYALIVFRYARSTSFIVVSALGMLGSVAVYAGFAFHLFLDSREWLAVFVPSLAFIGASLGTGWINFGETSNDRALVAEALGRFTSPAIVESVLRNPLLIAPKRREITILFSDIAGFTGISEALPAPRLAELLATYFTEMTAPITHTQGHVDKFIGDAVMAFWNAPLQQDKHALLACKAALQMRDRLEKIRPALKKEFGVEVVARAGLNTGEVVVGEMGARGKEGEAKTNYTCLGDAVNLSSRLEGVNKLYGTLILCGPRTVELCGDAFVFREVDQVRVKGKQEAVAVYELVCGKHDRLEPSKKEALARFAEGLAAYRARAFVRARELFEAALRASPGDGPSEAFRERCIEFAVHPPPKDWDGANSLDSK